MRFFRNVLLTGIVSLLTLIACAANDSTQVYVIQDIAVSGNARTRAYIILRELTFKTGDTIVDYNLNRAIEQSKTNLLNQPLFHFVHFEITDGAEPGKIMVHIDVTERWYTWLWPVFEISDRNFNAWLENGDLSRLSYGLFFQQENFRGRLEKLHVRMKLGYQQQVSLLYDVPYINHNKTIGAGFSFSAGRQREVAYDTEDNKLLYYRGHQFMLKEIDVALLGHYRPDIHYAHTLKLRYNQLTINDLLLFLNPEFNLTTGSKAAYTALSYYLKIDFRDQRAYPLKGWYADAELSRFGLLPGDNADFITIRPTLRFHFSIAPRWYIALGAAAKMTTGGEVPWYLNRAFGYQRDYVRGYEYYVTEGRHFWLLKSNIKFALLKPSVKTISWIKSDKFNTIPYSLYLSAFTDLGQAWPETDKEKNNLQGVLQSGTGVGLDFITYYDKVFRMEVSFNAKGEAGLFVHFMAAI